VLTRRLTPIRVTSSLLIVVTIAIVAASRAQMAAGVRSFDDAERKWLLVACLLVPAGVALRTLETWVAYRAVGASRPVISAVGLSATAYSVNKLVKSGGVAGLAVHLSDGLSRGVNRAHVIAAYVATRITGMIAMGALVCGAGAVFAVGWVSQAPVLPVVGAAGFAVCSVAMIGGYRLRRPRAPGSASRQPPLVHHGHLGFAFSGLRDVRIGLGAVRDHPRQLVPVAAFTLVSKAVGGLTLLAVLGALHLHVANRDVALTYAVASLASAVGPLPGGIGLADASIAAMLREGGAGSTGAVGAAMSFRLLDLWLPVALGGLVWLVRSRRPRHRTTIVGDAELRSAC
jgi:uncharacterized membrane protein YbhN (UPF0104 family)